MRALRWFLVWVMVVLGVVSARLSAAQRPTPIDASEHKTYRLTRQHGPWMIMVASFKEPPPEFKSAAGLTPKQAADKLVLELRKKGIPAYTFEQEGHLGRIYAVDRHGKESERVFAAQRGMISVLAGNYQSIDADGSRDGKVAQQTLAYIKRFHPRFLKEESSGARIRQTPGRQSPLAGAFFTVNPLLSPEEARARRRDPLLLKLNAGMEYSLLDNPGKYTLVVASFYGKSVTSISESKFRELAEKFNVSSALDEAMFSAWELAHTLRKARAHGYDRDFDAYVFHDRYQSIVTIGAFDSPDDPRIAHLRQLFGAKMKTIAKTGQDALLAEVLTIPRQVPEGVVPEKSWVFDPYPKVVPVPRLD